MPKRAKGLTAARVKTAPPGRYGDGDGLYLLVRTPELRFWVFRWVRNGKMREMGLGPAAGKAPVSLVDARAKAQKLRGQIRGGTDPIAERDRERAEAEAAAQLAAARAMTFRDAAEKYIAAQESGWRNPKHRQQWTNTLKTYAYRHFGDLPVADVDTEHVMAALEPIWTAKPETASRVRGRVECVLDYAKARSWRTGENPARWRGHVQNMLPTRKKVRRVEHHPALAWRAVGTFMPELRGQSGAAARALEFTILTGARTSEALGARWNEIDLENREWTVPAERMKAEREHRVPLSKRAGAILAEMTALRNGDDGRAFVFPGGRRGKPLSNMAMLALLRRMERADITVHGFRSTFKDWAAESTNYPNIISEAALAHVVGDKAEAAYRRGDLFEKRRRLMDDWAKFCATPLHTANVTPIRGAHANG